MSAELLETSEHTVLSRILYPDRSAALLYGKVHHSLYAGSSLKHINGERETDLTLGKLFHIGIDVKYANTLLLLGCRHCLDAEGRERKFVASS